MTLPFELNRSSVKHWFSQLNSLDAVAVGSEVLKALNLLVKQSEKLDSEELAQVVDLFDPVVVKIVEFLERIIIQKPDLYKLARLSSQLMVYLAQLHNSLAQTDAVNKALHANYALQMLGWSSFHRALSYERLPGSFWHDMGLAYQHAQEAGLDTLITSALPAFQPLNSGAKALRRNLLFVICNPYRFSRDEIQALFAFCTQKQALLTLFEHQTGFYWDYQRGKPPEALVSKPEGLKVLTFHAEALTKAVLNTQVSLPVTYSAALFNTLSNFQQLVRSTERVLPKYYAFVSGYEQVAILLNKHIRGGLISLINTPKPEKVLEYFELAADLEPEEQVFDRVSNDEIWGRQKKQERVELQYGAIKTFKTGLPAIYLAEYLKLPVEGNSLLILYGQSLQPLLAIARPIVSVKKSLYQSALLELVSESPFAVTTADSSPEEIFIMESYEGHYQCYLPGHKKFNLGTEIALKEGRLVLLRLLEETEQYMRYQVSFEANGAELGG